MRSSPTPRSCMRHVGAMSRLIYKSGMLCSLCVRERNLRIERDASLQLRLRCAAHVWTQTWCGAQRFLSIRLRDSSQSSLPPDDSAPDFDLHNLVIRFCACVIAPNKRVAVPPAPHTGRPSDDDSP